MININKKNILDIFDNGWNYMLNSKKRNIELDEKYRDIKIWNLRK